jgi:hypothetical protein
MRCSARVAFVLGAAAVLAGPGSACSPDHGPASDGGGADAGESCQQIRLCALDCADAPCTQACQARGSIDGRAGFEALLACTLATCALGDVNCLCREQCLADGNCLTEVDACLAGASADLVCDTRCH